MNGFHTLPHELQIQILRYLPPTAVFSLRLVCTAWNTILSSPHTERAISLSLLFPSTAPDLRSRLLRRKRLLRGDPAQIWDVDEAAALTKYCDGYVACTGMGVRAGELGIWDCRRKKCVALVDLCKTVKEQYPELWRYSGGAVSEMVEVTVQEADIGIGGVEPAYKFWVRDFFVQNGVVVVLGGVDNPVIPTNPQILLAFSLSTGALLQSWKLTLSARIFDARVTPSILLLITCVDGPTYDPSTPYDITTFSILTGRRLHTQPAPHAQPSQIALDTLDQFYIPAPTTYSIHNAHTGALITTIPLPPPPPSQTHHTSTILFTTPSHIHHISTTTPLPSPDSPLPSETHIHHTTYTTWTISAPHRRTTVLLPPLDGFNIAGTPDLTSYLHAVKWGVVLGEYYHFGQRCWVYNLSGRNDEVVAVGMCDALLKRCLPLRCYLDAPAQVRGKGWRRFKTMWKALGKNGEHEEEDELWRTRAPVLPDGVVCGWLPGELKDAEFRGGDDGVWLVCVPVGKEKWPTKMVVVSFDEEMGFPGKGWMARR